MNNTTFQQIIEHKDQHIYRYYSGNEWKVSQSGQTIDVFSPCDGSVLGRVQSVTTTEMDEAMSWLQKSQLEWEKKPFHERAKILRRAAQMMLEHESDLTDLLVVEIGKSKEESKQEVLRSAQLIDYVVSEGQSLQGQYIRSDLFPGTPKGKSAMIERVAHGVVVAIAPFNYPINLAVSKIAPALLMGNTVMFKPPTQGSISGLYLTEIFLRAGVPRSAIACMTGKGQIVGDYLVSHKSTGMVAFTGSTEVGSSIAGKSGMKPLLFECGGNNASLVFADADLNVVVKEIIKGAFAYAGQRCTGIKYLLAQEHIIDELMPLMIKEIETTIKVGDPRLNETKLVGPLISEGSAITVEQIIKEALQDGAELVYGGSRNGWYIDPTILKHVHPEMKIIRQETFGPVLSCIAVQDEEHMISIVNQSEYGLQSAIFTRDIDKAIRISRSIAVGTVQINGSPQRGPDHFPFMGIKASGVGVQGVRYSLEAMSRIKSVVVNSIE